MLQIIDIKWKYKNSKFVEELKFYDSESKETKSIPLKGYKFNYKLSEQKYCSGYYENGEYKACPYSNKLEKKLETMCFHCQSKEGFIDAFIMKRPPNESMKIHLSQPHYIYLAFFSPDKIKVGTAAESRKEIRLLEQDALIYSLIAEAPGFNIQDFERAISKSFSEITETVNSSFKFKHLTEKPNYDLANKLIMSAFKKIQEKFKDSEFNSWLFDNLAIIDNSNLVYFPRTQPDLLSNQLNIVGDFLGIRGKFLLVQNNDQYAFDVRELIGRRIEGYIDSFQYPKSEKAVQLGFF